MRILTMALLLILGFTLRASSAEITKLDNETLRLAGDIKQGDVEKLKVMLVENPGTQSVELYSNGGSAITGFRLGSLFDEKGLVPVVRRGEYCFSSCALAFIGVKNGVNLGLLGFHAAYREAYSAFVTPQRNNTNSQWFGMRITMAMIDVGFPYLFISEVIQTQPNQLLDFRGPGGLAKMRGLGAHDEVPKGLYRLLTFGPRRSRGVPVLP